LVDKANIFKYAGTMEDYELSKRAKTDSVPKIDYATFKRMCAEQAQAQAQAQADTTVL